MQFDSIKFLLLACSLTFFVYQVESVKFCGDKLNDALTTVCGRTGYNSKVKRLGKYKLYKIFIPVTKVWILQ